MVWSFGGRSVGTTALPVTGIHNHVHVGCSGPELMGKAVLSLGRQESEDH